MTEATKLTKAQRSVLTDLVAGGRIVLNPITCGFYLFAKDNLYTRVLRRATVVRLIDAKFIGRSTFKITKRGRLEEPPR